MERSGRGLLVLEAKYKKKVEGVERLIEPREPDIVAQAVNYATLGGYPYYATCNPKRLVLFKVIPGKRPYKSEVAAVDINNSTEH